MKKIAVIHDLSGLGKCSLTAAIPVISAMGVQACPLPTAILSNQTGYGSYFWDDYTDRMELIMDEWKKMGFKPDGVYTGFLGDARQVDLILKFVDMFCTEGTHILVDPVMGDRGETYKTYSETLCEKMRTLVREATVITPNLTEALLLLYGEEGMKERMKALSDMEETQLLKEIETSGSGERKSRLVFFCKRGRQLFRNRRSSGICSECGNGERDSHESMCGEGC